MGILTDEIIKKLDIVPARIGKARIYNHNDLDRIVTELSAGYEAQIKVLRDAAQAVIDRWETPLWKDVPATADYIYALRNALSQSSPLAALEEVRKAAKIEALMNAEGDLIAISSRHLPAAFELRRMANELKG